MGSRDNASPETTGPNTIKKHSKACEDTRIIVARMRRRAGEALNTRCHSLRSFANERKRFISQLRHITSPQTTGPIKEQNSPNSTKKHLYFTTVEIASAVLRPSVWKLVLVNDSLLT